MFHKLSLVVMIAFLYACEQGDLSELLTDTSSAFNVEGLCMHQASIQYFKEGNPS